MKYILFDTFTGRPVTEFLPNGGITTTSSENSPLMFDDIPDLLHRLRANANVGRYQNPLVIRRAVPVPVVPAIPQFTYEEVS